MSVTMDEKPLFDAPRKTCQSDRGSILASEHKLFTVGSVLKRGATGKVVKCLRVKDSKPGIIKMIRKHPNYNQGVKREVHLLKKLRELDPEGIHLVKWHEVFHDRAFTCLLFESMDSNLLHFTKKRPSSRLGLNTIRLILKQVASGLQSLKSKDIIHANLKLENVLVVNNRSEPCRAKLFDFSSAHEVSAARQGRCIQALPYRSPEIILGLPYNAAVDVWSLGCIAATLYNGFFPFPGKSPYEMLRYMVQTQGQPPDDLLNQGLMTSQYFIKDASSGSWRLKSHEEYFHGTECPPTDNNNKVLTSIEDILTLSSPSSQGPEDQSLCMFIDLLKGMLKIDAAERLTPDQVLQHPFIRMQHPVSMDLPGEKKPEATPGMSRSSPDSKVNPTKQSFKRKLSQDPRIEPNRKRIRLSPGSSCDTLRIFVQGCEDCVRSQSDTNSKRVHLSSGPSSSAQSDASRWVKRKSEQDFEDCVRPHKRRR